MDHSPILPAGASLESFARFLPSEAGAAPLMAVASALRGFNRDQLGSAIEVLIAVLDVVDGDADSEEDDPGEDSDPPEDDDPDTCVEDDPEGIDAEEDLGIDDMPHDEDEPLEPSYGVDQSEPLDLQWALVAEKHGSKLHRDRIRETRCVPRRYRDLSGRVVTSQQDFILLSDPVAPTRRQLLRRKRGVPRQPRA